MSAGRRAVMLPLALPQLGALAILTAVTAWNNPRGRLDVRPAPEEKETILDSRRNRPDAKGRYARLVTTIARCSPSLCSPFSICEAPSEQQSVVIAGMVPSTLESYR
jgi:hypothetical protein